MNGRLTKDIHEIFNAIVLPHIENIKEDIKDMNKKVDKITKCIVKNKVKIEGNKKDITNIGKNFRNNILLGGFIIAVITLLINIIIKFF